MKLGKNIGKEREWLLSLSKSEYVRVMQSNFGQRAFNADGQERHVTFQISNEAFEEMYDRLHGITQ